MRIKYNVVDSDKKFHDDLKCIEIQSGFYKGFVFQFDNVRFDEEKGTISYNYITVENSSEYDLNESDFTAILSEILNDLLGKYIEHADRTDDTETSDV